MLAMIGVIGGMSHLLLTESYRHAPASVVAPFDYTAMIWAFLLGYFVFGELPSVFVYRRRRDRRGVRTVRALARAAIWGRAPARASKAAPPENRRSCDPCQNALKQMIVWVSWMPGIFCTFSLTKWPMSVAWST